MNTTLKGKKLNPAEAAKRAVEAATGQTFGTPKPRGAKVKKTR